MAVDTMQYEVRADTLAVDGRPIAGQFRRAELGARVASPVAAEFYALVDGVEKRSVAVASRIPTAHLRRRRGGRMVLWADIAVEDFSSAWIRVEIRRYRGPGVYAIGPGQGELALVAGDAITLHEIDSRGSGFIHIRSCDMRGRRCSGQFEFLIRDPPSRDHPEQGHRVTNGRFSVPVYPY